MTAPTDYSVVGPRPVRGHLRVPGDKSISHRALLLAAIADGESRLRGLAQGDDVQRTRVALEDLGVRMRDSEDALIVKGTGGRLTEPKDVLYAGNSGTMRILLGILAAQPFLTVLTGDLSLKARPMARVVEPLRAMGAAIDGRQDGGLAPLAIRGAELKGERFELPIASGQVKSALLLAGLQADGVTEVVEPRLSRDHTERMLGALGAPIERIDERTVRVRRGSVEPFDLAVPGDPSSAAFFVVAACINPGSHVVLENVCLNPTRIAFVDALRRMGGQIEARIREERMGEPVGDLEVEAGPLTATKIAGDEIPFLIDEIPALAVAAAFAHGVTEIRDADELRVKESDRIATLHQELSQFGVRTEKHGDGLTIHGGTPHAAKLKSHGDHRIAMAAAVAAVACEGTSVVRNWSAVATSYPDFDHDLEALTSRSAP